MDFVENAVLELENGDSSAESVLSCLWGVANEEEFEIPRSGEHFSMPVGRGNGCLASKIFLGRSSVDALLHRFVVRFLAAGACWVH